WGDHTETVALDFDPDIISYESLLQKFWKSHNPFTPHRNQYMSAIFYHNQTQKQLAEHSMADLQKESVQPIATKILPAETFYNAEDYHQKYMLRQHIPYMKGFELSDEDIITSSAAAKLNGFLGGFGDIETFEKVQEEIDLTPTQVRYITRQIEKKCRY
ncbi:hypothetical protein KUTeg_018816, partial [Tegillarca granosa]